MQTSSGISFKALVIGVAVDIGGSIIASIIFGILLAILLSFKGYSPSDIEELVTDPQNNTFLVSGLLIGLMCTFFGGFTAAHFAEDLKVMHSGIIGAISVLFGLLYFLLTDEFHHSSLWYSITGLSLTIPVALAGGYAAEKNGGGETESQPPERG